MKLLLTAFLPPFALDPAPSLHWIRIPHSNPDLQPDARCGGQPSIPTDLGRLPICLSLLHHDHLEAPPPLFFFLILSAGLHAQDDPVTGTGVLLLTEPTLTFPPTPQDSTATISVTLINDVGADQTIDFTGLDAPFSASPNAFTIAANADTTVTFSFTPDSTGLFTADITATGNVFGEATLTLAGEGTLVQLVWLNGYNDAGIVPIGQTGFAGDSLYNMGTGTATLQLLGDSVQGPFTLLQNPTTIAGSNLGFNQAYFNVIFAPSTRGTRVPSSCLPPMTANPVLSLEVSGTGISEVSGEICDQTWTAANSPYTSLATSLSPKDAPLPLNPSTDLR